MNRLFWGLFFVLIDYELTVGTAVFEILPDFIGFFLIMRGMESLAGKSVCFDRGRHVSFGLLLASGVLYGAALMDPENVIKVWLWAMELVCLGLTMLILCWTVRGFRQMGLACVQARGLWPVLAVVLVLGHLLNWVPVVGDICRAAGVIVSLCFLAALYGSAKGSGTK